jgi:hypothetical protein
MAPGMAANTPHPTAIELKTIMTAKATDMCGLLHRQEVALQTRITAIATSPAARKAMTEAQAKIPAMRGRPVVAVQAKR